MDNFYEYAEAGQDKHQRMMQEASDYRRQARTEENTVQQPVPRTLGLRPILTSLINLVTR